MAKGIATSMLRFAEGVSKNLTPNASKKAMSGIGKAAAKELTGSMAFKNGDALSKGLLKNSITSGTANTIRSMNQGVKFNKAIKDAHSVGGKLSAGKIAGTVATVGVAGRVATGGGLYRDRYGNFNIPGVPFI